MLLSEFIKDFGVKKYFRTPKNLDYSLLVNFIQLVLEGDWFGKASIPQDFSQNSDILDYFRVLDQEGFPDRDALRFGDMYIILSKDRYRYGVFLNNGAVLEQPNHLNPQHEVLHDDINKHIAWVKSRGFDVVLLRPLNEKNIFPSDDLRYIKQDKPFAHVTFDVLTDMLTVYAPGNHATYSDPIWGNDPTNKQIEVLAKQEIYHPLWLHLLDRDKTSYAAYTGTYDGTTFTTWQVPVNAVTDPLGMLSLMTLEADDYTTGNIKWTEAIPKRPIVFNVKDFGAVGDDTHDDITNINATVAAALSAGGGIVFFPAGIYKITDSINVESLVSYIGVGGGSLSTSIPGSTINQVTINKDAFLAQLTTVEIQGVRIENLRIQGTQSGTGNGIYLKNIGHDGIHLPFYGWSLRDLFISGFGGCGFKAESIIVSVLERVTSEANDTGFYLSGQHYNTVSTSTSFISCYANVNTTYGYHVDYCTYLGFHNCAADSNGTQYYFDTVNAMSLMACGAEYGSEPTATPGNGVVISACGQISLYNFYNYQNKNIAYWVKNNSTGIFFHACEENSPLGTATASYKVEDTSVIVHMGVTYDTPLDVDDTAYIQVLSNALGQLPAPKINYVNNINGKKTLEFEPNAGAVNYVNLRAASTTQSVLLSLFGDDANITLNIVPKGTGEVGINGDRITTDNSTAELRNKTYVNPLLLDPITRDIFNPDNVKTIDLQNNAAGINYVTIRPASHDQAVVIGAVGADTDVTLNLLSQGAGEIWANSIRVVDELSNQIVKGKRIPIQGVSADHTTDRTLETVYIVDATSGNVTIDLPPVGGNNGKEYIVKKSDNSVNTVTIAADGSDTIENNSTLVLTTQFDYFHIIDDGAHWFIIGKN